MDISIKKVCCIGAGYVGGPTMAVIADKCNNIEINVVDINDERIKFWNSTNLNKLPIYEPGLDKIIERCRGRNLHFSTEIEKNIASADMIFISVNTPTKKRGLGAGQASDLKWVEASARQVAKFAKGHTIVVEKSTLPVKTAKVIQTILESAQISSEAEKKTFEVLSNPEFLSEGNAIKDLEFPDRVLIGGESEKAIKTLSKIYEKWVPQEKILHTNIWSSELAKLTANAFLAQRISSINSISALCEKTGAEINEVANAIGTDSRIGKKFLSAGPGFGGSCFKKDILNLVYLLEYYGLKDAAEYWNSVLKINNWQKKRISNYVIEKLNGTVSGKKITILGFSFKANTNDTRESPAIDICLDLLEEGAILAIHDPKVNTNQIKNEFEKSKFTDIKSWSYSSNIYENLKNSHAILILTEWTNYQNLNWQEIEKLMLKPSWVFDTRIISDYEQIKKTNLNFWRIGKIEE